MPTAAPLFRFQQDCAWRTALQLLRLTREVGLVGVSSLGCQPGELAARLLERPGQGDEALEAKDAVQRLRRQADGCFAAAAELAL